MAHWKPSVEFLLSVIELLFLSLTVEALQGKMCQNSLPSGGGGSVSAKISGGRSCPPANILIPLAGIREKYSTVSSLADLFNRVDNHTVIDFIKKTHFYHQP